MERPTGVTVLAVLQFIGAAFCVLAGLAFFFGGTFIGALAGSAAGGGQGGATGAGLGMLIGAVGGVMFLIFAALYGVVGWGMWTLKNWARIVSLVLAAIGAVVQIPGVFVSLLHFRIGSMLWSIIWIGVNGLIIWYLLQPQVKLAFDGQQPQSHAAGI